MSSNKTTNPWPTATGALKFSPPDPTEEPDISLNSVTPARRDWLPELLEELLPAMVEAVQEVAERHDPKLLHMPRTGLVPLALHDVYGVDAVSGWYPFAAAKFAVCVRETPIDEWPDRQSDDRPPSLDTLVKVGQGYDELNTSIDHLEPGPVQLIAVGSDTPQVSLSLDEDAWCAAQRAQRKRGLDTIAILSKAITINLIASPSLEKFLHDRHPEWIETYLTESKKTSPGHAPTSGTIETAAERQAVFEKLKDFTPGGGKLQLLAAIPAEEGEYRELHDLKNDSELNIASGTIGRYYLELEDEYDLLAVDDRGDRNLITLTPAGRYAQTLLTEDSKLLHPKQVQFSDAPTTPLPPNRSQE